MTNPYELQGSWHSFPLLDDLEILLCFLITCEYLHFQHLVATGGGKPGRMVSSCWVINSCTSSSLCSKCVTPNGTVVWTTSDGPHSDDSVVREEQEDAS